MNQSERQSESLKAFVGLSRTVNYLESIARDNVTKYGLNLNEFAVLELLLHKGATPIQQIKEKILIASSSTTYIVDQLVKKGYVHRVPCQKDRRVTYADLTEEGGALIRSIFPAHAEALTAAFEDLSDEELTVLRATLKKLSETALKQLS